MADAAKSDAARAASEQLPDVTSGWGRETFGLAHPFRFAGIDYREIAYRVPTGADIDAVIRTTDGTNRALALHICEADEALIDAMHGSDYAGLMRRMGEYFTGSR